MILRILHVLAQVAEAMRTDLPPAVVSNFAQMGRAQMREYLKDVTLDDNAMDMLGDLIAKYYGEGMSLDDSVFEASIALSDNARHWEDVAATPWYDEIKTTIRQVVGYIDNDGSGNYENLPAGLTFLQKEQLRINEEHLQRAVLEAMAAEESYFLEAAAREYFREFQEDYVAPQRPETLSVEDEETSSPDSDFLVEEPADYSGRFAHAVV